MWTNYPVSMYAFSNSLISRESCHTHFDTLTEENNVTDDDDTLIIQYECQAYTPSTLLSLAAPVQNN